MMAEKRQKGDLQLVFWGSPIESPKMPLPGEIIPCIFDDSLTLRAMTLRNELWFIATEVCRGLGLDNVTMALSRLDPDEKNTLRISEGNRGNPNVCIVSEAGLYRLVGSAHTKGKPNVAKFQRWLYHDVLPSLRKYGCYIHRPLSRVEREARRLKADRETAKVRCDQFATNRALQAALLAAGGCVRDVVNYHEEGYIHEFGMKACDLRVWVGAKERETALDYMAMVPLSINQHAKAIATRMVEMAESSGAPIPPAERATLFGKVIKEVKEQSFGQFDKPVKFDVVDDPKRGRVIDVVADTPTPPRLAAS